MLVTSCSIYVVFVVAIVNFLLIKWTSFTQKACRKTLLNIFV